MTDKKTFGSFIKLKRTEKNYSQKDLAELLFVTEGAVSKWERGVSYPDITLLSDICRVLDVSERELITASNDTEARRIKNEAKSYRVIRGAWFWIPTVSYAVALLTCFICNLAVDHTLSWFFIVLAALICAYSFIPTFSSLFKRNKLLIFTATSYLSICLLLFTCAVYTRDVSWLLTACIGILIGYVSVFVPLLLSKTKISRYKFVFSFSTAFILTVLLLLNIRIWHSFMLLPSVLITCYAFTPAIISTCVCTLRLDAFLKSGICVALSTVLLSFTSYTVDVLFGTNESSYQVDFSDWSRCLEGNVTLITLVSLLLASAVFIYVGAMRVYKNRKR